MPTQAALPSLVTQYTVRYENILPISTDSISFQIIQILMLLITDLLIETMSFVVLQNAKVASLTLATTHCNICQYLHLLGKEHVPDVLFDELITDFTIIVVACAGICRYANLFFDTSCFIYISIV